MTALRCRYDLHAWRTLFAYNGRWERSGDRSVFVYTRDEQCARCHLSRTRDHAPRIPSSRAL